MSRGMSHLHLHHIIIILGQNLLLLCTYSSNAQPVSIDALTTLADNVMESPTRWLHGFIFRHDFEIIRDSLYKSCSRDYSYICRRQINVKKAEQMQIVSLNWWEYAVRVWSHANSAQPHNSHLAPKLEINTAHWNNSLHAYWWNMILPFSPLH